MLLERLNLGTGAAVTGSTDLTKLNNLILPVTSPITGNLSLHVFTYVSLPGNTTCTGEVLGVEIFSTVVWTLGANWSENGTKLIGTGTTVSITKNVLQTNHKFRISTVINSMSGDTCTIYINNVNVGQITTTGVKSYDRTPTSSAELKISPWNGTGLNIETDNWSVKEIYFPVP
jgi:hypothetical protein